MSVHTPEQSITVEMSAKNEYMIKIRTRTLSLSPT